MLSYVQVITAPSADTPGGCVVLHFDNRRYFFGRVAEGTQRNMVQRKVSLAKVRDIFLSGSIAWDATGGLLGMILTLADLHAASAADHEQNRRARPNKRFEPPMPQLNIHGGKNLVHLLATARRFILRKALPVQPRELSRDPRADEAKRSEPDYEDENIRVWSVVAWAQPPEAPRNALVDELLRSSSENPPKKRKLSPISDEDADQSVRESVVRDMFSSKWNLDTLHEVRLADVRQPAKIFVRSAQGHIEPYEGPTAFEAPDTKVLVRNPWPASQLEHLPPTTPSTQSMSYIVKCHARRGKFDPTAAERLGVAKRDRKVLAGGNNVTTEQGRVVTPDMVVGPSVKGHGFAVMDIPSVELLEPSLARHEWANEEIMDCIDTMYWILSDSVSFEGKAIQAFIEKHSSIKHIVLGRQLCPNLLALESPSAQLLKMHTIDKDRFPLPQFHNRPAKGAPNNLRSLIETGHVGHKWQLAPTPLEQVDSIVPHMDTKKAIWQLQKYAPKAVALAKAARRTASDPKFRADEERSRQTLPRPDTQIIPLGTGSAMPSKYRNVSATLIRVPGWGSYLLDCGENTLGQLRRSFGYIEADNILRDLRAIYVSHAHADHHLGTVSVMAQWHRITKAVPADANNKLAIIAPSRYQDFIRESFDIEPVDPQRIVQIALHPRDDMNQDSEPGPIRPIPGRRAVPGFPRGFDPATLRLPYIQACFVDHCFEATAIILTFPPENADAADAEVEETNTDADAETVPVDTTDVEANTEAAVTDVAEYTTASVTADTPADIDTTTLETNTDADTNTVTDTLIPDTLSETNPQASPEPHLGPGNTSSSLRIAYSGDCRPSPRFAHYARGAHLLIHECTFEDELSGDALAKKHSTLSEALDIGRQMGARRILLTHFSQRYPKLPTFDKAALSPVPSPATSTRGFGGKQVPVLVDAVDSAAGVEIDAEITGEAGKDVEVLFAFDMMRVKLGDFKTAQLYLPALRELLAQTAEVEAKEDASAAEL